MGDAKPDSAPAPARRQSLLDSIGAVEHPAEVAAADKPAAPSDDHVARPARVNDGEGLVAFTPFSSDDAQPDADAAATPPRSPVSDPFAEFEAALAATYAPPAAAPAPPQPPRVTRRDLRLLSISAVLVALLALLFVVISSRPAGDHARQPAMPTSSGAPGIGPRAPAGATAGTSVGPSGASGQPGAAPSAGVSGAVGAPAAPPASANAGEPVATAATPTTSAGGGGGGGGGGEGSTGGLTATYRTSRPSLLGLLGYQGEITVRNPTASAIDSWTVVIELPGANTVTSTDGVAYLRKNGQYWFIPTGAGTIGPGASFVFTFNVSGVLTGPPLSCSVDDRPCS